MDFVPISDLWTPAEFEAACTLLLRDWHSSEFGIATLPLPSEVLVCTYWLETTYL
jgi:hypothetical protein